MMQGWLRGFLPLRPGAREERLLEAEFAPLRRALRRAGLKEDALRRMDPDQRVEKLEQARLDPYDYIYLAC